MAIKRSTRNALLVGSVPLENTEAVFRLASTILGDRLRRIPDGETGVRKDWIGWQIGVLAAHPAFVADPPAAGTYAAQPRVRLRAPEAAADLTFGPLGYAAAALNSYAVFARLQREGVIPPGCRFQVSLPTPLAPITALVRPNDHAAVEPAYEAQMLAEVAAICAAVPHEALAIQWDVAIELAAWEGVWPVHLADVKRGVIERLVRLGDHIPAAVELGYHLCYGDYGHQHFKQPADTTNLVEVANRVTVSIKRPIDWLHLPVPRDRDDEAYFAPLRGLQRHPGTEMYLGLVHLTDGLEGTRRRLATARRMVADFGLATECGLGRRPPATIPAILQLHAQAIAELTAT